MKKDLLKIIIGAVVVVALGTGLVFYSGVIGNVFDSTIAKESKNIARENFKENKTYIEGKADDLQRYKREFDKAKTEEDKKAIMVNIQDEFSDFDENKLENKSLRQFLNQARNYNFK